MERFSIDRRYGLIFSELGLPMNKILLKADLSENLFMKKNITLTTNEYFNLMKSIGDTICDESIPIKIATADMIETFSPPVFAAFCSRNAQKCFERLAKYKKLIGPMKFELTKNENNFELQIIIEDKNNKIPWFLEIIEFVFLINLIRKATMKNIIPIKVAVQNSINNKELEKYFGCRIQKSDKSILSLSIEDSLEPFISENETMWEYLEPEFKRRMDEIGQNQSFTLKVRKSIMKLLPAGISSIEQVSKSLGMSTRTLQRKLYIEKTTFKNQLNYTREVLAKNYMKNTEMTTDDIAFLLGYSDMNSFVRAFKSWTDMSITQYKKTL